MKVASYISLLWAGLLLGTSFLATPAKFLAPSLSLQEALEVGKATFMVLAWVEYVFLAALIISISILKSKPPVLIVTFGIIILLLIVQHLFVLPTLELRTDLIIQGQYPGSSNLHLYYIAVEFLKICSLVVFATVANTVVKRPLILENQDFLTDI